MKKIMVLLLMTLGFSSCHVYTDYDPYTPTYSKVDSFVNMLNDQYWQYDDFNVVKSPYDTYTEGFVVVYSDDFGYMAFDIMNYSMGESWYSYSSTSDYLPVNIDWVDSDYYSGEALYYGDTYYNDYYGSYAGYFVFEETPDTVKDLEKVKAMKEEYKVFKIGNALSTEYGLSEERGVKIARLATNWDKISSGREMTDSDANAFSSELLGVEMKTIDKAIEGLKAGNKDGLNSLIEKAASANGVGPEHMKKIVESLL